jgi:hypothetical protein
VVDSECWDCLLGVEMKKLLKLLASKLIKISDIRPPDFVVGDPDQPYLKRWWLIPRNRYFNIYLHHFLRSDEDRALHDHPWPNVSILIEGSYIEHTINAGGIKKTQELRAGDIKMRPSGKSAHRIEILNPCWTLFITGMIYRNWGFHCPDKGWVPWEEFTSPSNKGLTGRGCD